MGAYGSPDTYPYHTLDENKKQNAAPRPPKPSRSIGVVWIAAAVFAVILLMATDFTLLNVFIITFLYACAYTISLLILLVFRKTRGEATAGIGKKLGISLAVIFCSFILVGITATLNASDETAASSVQPAGLSQSNYDRIKKGDAYEEVCEIFGAEGNRYYETGFPEDENYVAYYTWGSQQSYAQMQFRGGKLTEKAAYNLP